MISVKDQSLRDLCLLWGCPGVVFLTISMFVALKVGADFQQDGLAKWAAFLLCNLLLWLLYVMFQSILVDLLPKKWKGESPITRPLTEKTLYCLMIRLQVKILSLQLSLRRYHLSNLNLFNTPTLQRV